MINCLVIFGGESCEHDISIVTGVQVVNKLDEYLYNIIPVYIDKNGEWWTGDELKNVDNFNVPFKKVKQVSLIAGDKRLYYKKKNKYIPFCDVGFAFVCLHGLKGEDGSLSAVLELSGIPYSSSSLLPSAVCLDKSIFKIVCKGINVNVVDGFYIDKLEYLLDEDIVIDKINDFGLPIILKPSRQGSSVGIEVCEDINNLKIQLNKAFLYDDRVVVERYIDIDKELNIAVYNVKGEIVFSQVEEPVFSSKILSFDDKYLKNINGFEDIKRILPAEISKELKERICQVSKKLYLTLKMFGVVRFDFILSKEGDLFVNEVNTIPGSMANYLFEKPFNEFLNDIRSSGVHRLQEDLKMTKSYDSSFLSSCKNFIKK